LEWAQRSAHAQTTDTRLNVLRNKNEALKKQLAWFEEAWSWVKAAMLRVQELEEVKAFRRDEVLLKLVAPIIRKIEERDRPKPEEGT
jgi:prophage DNA circulation protein